MTRCRCVTCNSLVAAAYCFGFLILFSLVLGVILQ